MRLKLNLRLKLILILSAIIVLTMLLFTGIVRWVMTDYYEQSVRQQDAQMVQVLAQNINQFIGNVDEAVGILGTYPGLMSLPGGRQHEILARFFREHPHYDLLAFIDMQGLQTGRSDGQRLGNRANRPWFRSFQATHAGSVSAVYYSATDCHLIFTLTHGIYDAQGQPTGLIMADVLTDDLQKLIRESNVGDACRIYLLDNEGNAVVRPQSNPSEDGLYNYRQLQRHRIRRDNEQRPVRNDKDNLQIDTEPFTVQPGLQALIERAMDGESGVDSYWDDDDQQSNMVVYRSIAMPSIGLNWSLVMVRPYDTVAQPIVEVMRQMIYGGLLVAVLAIIIIWVASSRLLAAFSDIQRLMARASRGDFSGRLQVGRHDEVGELAANVNQMLQRLAVAQEKEQLEKWRIKQLAYNDNLTGLPNRLCFYSYVDELLGQARHDTGSCGALLFVDLDHFKEVNDTYGHAVGDELLIRAGFCLIDIAGRRELVCRFGGDEFLLFLPGASQVEAEARARSIVDCMGQRVDIYEHIIQISASVGVARYFTDGDTLDDLVHHADEALYTAKERGRNQYCLYADKADG